jgi:hypothetical protein
MAGFDAPPVPVLVFVVLANVTVPATALVDCVPLGLPAEVLTYRSFRVCGCCQ